MRKYAFALFLSFLFLPCIAQSNIDRATKFINHLKKGESDLAYSFFDAKIKGQVSVVNLELLWEDLTKKLGKHVGYKDTLFEKNGAFEIVVLTTEFTKADIDIKFIFDKENLISGFFFLPAKDVSQSHYKNPVYENSQLYTEREIVIKSNKGYELPGNVIYPKEIKDKKYPVVIFVQGSGPSDRNESVGATKSFRDLAVGLGQNGIISIRFDKVTKVHSDLIVKQYDSLTVKEEVIDDVSSAILLAKTLANVDTSKIYVLGHSLGGMLAPRINLYHPELKGLILMAPNARPMEDLLEEQLNYIFSIDGLTQEEKDKLLHVQKQVLVVKSATLSLATPKEELPLGLPAKYWLDLKSYNQIETAKHLKTRMIIMQGERDYQVTMKDFMLWKQELSSHQNVSFKSYPLLNHQFIEGQGKSLPSEYMKPNNVPEYLIKDIVDWIKK